MLTCEKSRILLISCLVWLLASNIQAFRSSLPPKTILTKTRDVSMGYNNDGRGESDHQPASLRKGITSKASKAASLAVLVATSMLVPNRADAKV